MATFFGRDGFLIGFITLIVLVSAADLMVDLSHGVSNYHVLQEALVLGIGLAVLLALMTELRRNKQHLQSLRQTLNLLEQQQPLAQSTLVSDVKPQLSQAIADQFTKWQLTQSEKEVGMMLLKGFSLKEIALLRGTAEKTIRQQASSIYQKAGVAGRHAFSGWFIEDLI